MRKASKETKEVAKKMLKLFGANGKNWIQGTWAEDKHGNSLSNPDSTEACSWCLDGALQKIAGPVNNSRYSNIRANLNSRIPASEENAYARNIIDLNDSVASFKPIKKFLRDIIAS